MPKILHVWDYVPGPWSMALKSNQRVNPSSPTSLTQTNLGLSFFIHVKTGKMPIHRFKSIKHNFQKRLLSTKVRSHLTGIQLDSVTY